jgi:Ca-activated chloride channel family protein
MSLDLPGRFAALGPIHLLHPQALYLLIGVAAVLLWWLVQSSAPRHVFAPILRAIVLCLVVLALAQPQTRSTSQGSARPVALDLSASITPPMRREVAAIVRDTLKLRDSDPAVVFAGRPVVETAGEALHQLEGSGCEACEPDRTDLQTAVRKLLDLTGGGPMVLITDGWQNRGDATASIDALLAAHGRLYILTPPGGNPLPDVGVTAISMPHALPSTDAFDVGVTLTNLNDHPVRGTLQLFENGRLLEGRAVAPAPGSERIDFAVRDASAGLTSYRAVFKPADAGDDLYPEDNSLQAWIGIGAKRKVLIFSDSPRDATYLTAVARRLGFDPEVAAAGATGVTRNLSGFDAVIMENIARSQMPAATQDALIRYVEGGGALAMVGGDRCFGLGGWQNSAVAKMMPVVMKPPQHQERRRALVLIVDKSGSMGRENKLTYAKLAARAAADTLRDDDLIEVIGFDSQPFVIVPLEPVRAARPYLAQLVDRLKPRGTTYLLPALQQAERDLAASGASIKHIVILTDGETGGTAAMYYDLVASMHHQGGVTVSTIAIGNEANLTLLDSISRYGGGAAYQTNSPSTLPEVTLQDTRQHTADQTMVEKQFVPQIAPGDSLLKGLARRTLPPIKGFVSTQLRQGARLDAWVERGGVREPLIASTSYGAGKTVAITTDAGGRWAADWIRQNVFGTLWDRVIAWMTPPALALPKYDVAMGFRDGRISLHVTNYSYNPQHALAVVSARVTGPDNTREDIELSQTAVGEQAGSFAAPRPGTYYITLRSGLGGKEQPFPPLAYTVSTTHFVEAPRPDPNYGLLESLASATGGRLNPSAAEITMTRPLFQSTTGFARPLLLAAMIILMLEALVRRLTA